MSDIDKAREEYKHALRSTYVSRDADECGRTYGLVDEDKADVLIAALEAENEALKAENERIRDLAGEYAPHLVIPKRRQP